MSLKITLRALVLAASIAVEGDYPKNKLLIGQDTPELTQKQKIEYIIEQQINLKSYGRNLHHPLSSLGTNEVLKDTYDDGFKIGNHTFGTRITNDKGSLNYITIFADNITLIDFYGDGVDSGQIFERNYDPVKSNIGNIAIQEIPITGNGSNKRANEFQGAVLDVIIEKYNGKVNPSKIKQYETKKNNLLKSITSNYKAPSVIFNKQL